MKDECVNNGGRMENHCWQLIYNSLMMDLWRVNL